MASTLHLPQWTPSKRLRVGVFLPMSGAAGLWGPSCRASAELAAAEINRRGGIGGRLLELAFYDAGRSAGEVSKTARAAVRSHQIDAIVGMHTSDVRTALNRTLGGVLPFVYTPLYEGSSAGETALCIGETPMRQLLPGADWLRDRYRLRRWFLVGNDYEWPRLTHQLLKHHWRGAGQTICAEEYVPFGTTDFATLIDRILVTDADAVLVSLVGTDSVLFNRQFARSRAAATVVRYSCALEENMLMALGPDATDGLFASAGYFAALGTRNNGAFRERYYTRFGDHAPQLNTIGQSMYEGIRCLEGALADENASAFGFSGVRTDHQVVGRASSQPVYLAEARGLDFNILTQLNA